MINKILELKRLELNKQNVMKVLFDCKATESSKKTFDVSFYSNKSSRKAPKISSTYIFVISCTVCTTFWL